MDPELEKEYQEFLKSLNQEGGPAEGDEAMGQFTQLMANLMNGMKMHEDPTVAGGNVPGGPEGGADAQLKNILSGLMGSVGNDNFDSMAQNFLREFMDKDILQEPLTEAKKNYETYLGENVSKLNETDKKNYTEQYNCINELLTVIDKEPENKEKMINIFEKMHDYGMPPEGILNPLQQAGMPMGMPGMPGMGGMGGLGGVPPGMPNMKPDDMAKQLENCNMF